MKYSIILPAYNEEESLDALYKRVKKVMDALMGQYELLFVNDGSSDNTALRLLELHKKDPKVKIISFSRNFGHQVAVSAGLKYAKGEVIAILDSDLQDPPEVLPRFFAKLEQGYDAVYAVRRDRKEGFLKRFMYSAFYRFLKKIASIDIPLDSGDFSVMSRRVVDAINMLPERNRFVRGLRSWVGFRQVGLMYERDARYAGASKYTLSRLFKLAFDGIFSFSYVPLQMMFYLGLISLLLGTFGAGFSIYKKYFTNAFTNVPGFATTTILLFFIGGLVLFCIGILGEYIKRIYDEIKARPSYIIDSTVGIET